MTDSAAGKAAMQTIIPMVAFLARTCPVALGQVLHESLLQELKVQPDTSCSHLDVVDAVFERIHFK